MRDASPSRWQRWLFGSATLVLCGSMTACGVGLVIGVDGEFDNPPAVSLAASPTRAFPEERLLLVAAATDDDYVDEVEFDRLEPDGRVVRLCSDRSAPFECLTAVPATAVRGSDLRFRARAWDSRDQSTDSEIVTVRVE